MPVVGSVCFVIIFSGRSVFPLFLLSLPLLSVHCLYLSLSVHGPLSLFFCVCLTLFCPFFYICLCLPNSVLSIFLYLFVSAYLSLSFFSYRICLCLPTSLCPFFYICLCMPSPVCSFYCYFLSGSAYSCMSFTPCCLGLPTPVCPLLLVVWVCLLLSVLYSLLSGSVYSCLFFLLLLLVCVIVCFYLSPLSV